MTQAFYELWIPIACTIIFAGLGLRPYSKISPNDRGIPIRLLWLIPILTAWILYFTLKSAS